MNQKDDLREFSASVERLAELTRSTVETCNNGRDHAAASIEQMEQKIRESRERQLESVAMANRVHAVAAIELATLERGLLVATCKWARDALKTDPLPEVRALADRIDKALALVASVELWDTIRGGAK